MARLSMLKLSMTTTILLVGIVFAVFLAGLMYLISILWELPPLEMYAIAILGAGVFIFIEYLIGPSVVTAAKDLHYLNPGENPLIEETVSNLANKSGLPMPRLAIVPDETPNAFVFGRTAKSATLAVHEGLLRQLNIGEVEGVIGHELGHLHHKDYLVMTALAAVPLIAYIIARVSFETMRFGRFRGRGKGAGLFWLTIIAAAAISYVVYLITQLCVRRKSPARALCRCLFCLSDWTPEGARECSDEISVRVVAFTKNLRVEREPSTFATQHRPNWNAKTYSQRKRNTILTKTAFWTRGNSSWQWKKRRRTHG